MRAFAGQNQSHSGSIVHRSHKCRYAPWYPANMCLISLLGHPRNPALVTLFRVALFAGWQRGPLPIATARLIGSRPKPRPLWTSREAFFTDAGLFLLGAAGAFSANIVGALPGCESSSPGAPCVASRSEKAGLRLPISLVLHLDRSLASRHAHFRCV